MHRILFLTFSIFLFVSCEGKFQNQEDASIENTILMVENTQEMNLNLYYEGNSFISFLMGEYADKSNPEKFIKLDIYKKYYTDSDKDVLRIIIFIENLKIKLLKEAGENYWDVKDKDPNCLVWKKMDTKLNYIQLSEYNLKALKDKNKNNLSNSIFTIDEYNPSKIGLELWNELIRFRRNFVDRSGTYAHGENFYSLKTRNINSFSSQQDLIDKVSEMLSENTINKMDDSKYLSDIYQKYSFQEWTTNSKGKKTHWINKRFSNQNLVGALFNLTELQYRILSMRKIAYTYKYYGHFGNCSYDFNRIESLAKGPAVAKVGDEIQIKVLLAAYNDFVNPTLESKSPFISISKPSDGYVYVTVKVKKGKTKYHGDISIKARSGIKQTKPWEWEVVGIEE